MKSNAFLCVCFVGVCPAVGAADGIAFDWINRRIYYSDFINQTINSMAEDGSDHTVLAHVSNPRAIVLDPCQGYALSYFFKSYFYLLIFGGCEV